MAGMIQGSRTSTYVPTTLASYAWGNNDFDGAFSRYDIDKMDHDPRCRIGFRILVAPVEAATWTIECDNPDCEAWIDRTIKHFWTHDLTRAAGMLKYGSQGGEWVWRFDEDTGIWEYDTLRDFHLNDVRPLTVHGNYWGVRVRGVEDPNRQCPSENRHNGTLFAQNRGHIDLQYPSACWLANEPKFSSFYGISRYEGAWKPWKEKRGKHGAVDVRKNWMMRNSMRGAMLRYPEGTTEVSPGIFVPNQDVAREVVEKYMAGHVMALPGVRDDKGNYQWEWIEARAGEDVSSILKYSPMLDVEILEGMEIWPEVLQAPDVGAGWSGRALPYLQFLSSENRINTAIMTGFVKQVVRPGVQVNFGPKQRFRVIPNSLLPQNAPAQTVSQQGAAGLVQQPTAAAQPPQTPGSPEGPSPVPEQVQMAMDTNGIARKAAVAAQGISSEVDTAVKNAIIRFRQRLENVSRSEREWAFQQSA